MIVVIGRNRRCSGKSSSPMTSWNSRRNSANSSRWRGVEGVCGGEGIVGRVIGTLGLVRMVVEIISAVAGKGRGVVGISLPVRIFEPRSLLERITDWWTLFPYYFNLAS